MGYYRGVRSSFRSSTLWKKFSSDFTKEKRKRQKNLKVTINYHRARYHTRFSVDERFFDKESQLILSGVPSYRTINKVLADMVRRIEDRLAESPMTERQFLEFCKREFEVSSAKKTFVDYMDEWKI